MITLKCVGNCKAHLSLFYIVYIPHLAVLVVQEGLADQDNQTVRDLPSKSHLNNYILDLDQFIWSLPVVPSYQANQELPEHL